VSQTELSERLEQWLREAGVAFEVLEHALARTSEEAARVRGTRLEQGAKALVDLVRVSDAPVCRFATMEG
jgi:Ala-tRNA(Pro) deacylase